jgi:delta 1-pyrroline-5-carboxylate dehydrogenase
MRLSTNRDFELTRRSRSEMSKTEQLHAQEEYETIKNRNFEMLPLVQRYLGFVYDATNQDHVKALENEEDRLARWHAEVQERKEIEDQLGVARAEAQAIADEIYKKEKREYLKKMQELDESIDFIRFKEQDDTQTLAKWFDARAQIAKVEELYARKPDSGEIADPNNYSASPDIQGARGR